MPNPNYPQLPDVMPLRDALRGLRRALRRGGETLIESMPVESLPRPAADLAGVMLREVGVIAKGVNEVASGIARLALGAGDAPAHSLAELAGRQNPEDSFAAGLYAALAAVLRRLHAPSVHVSETAARAAYLSLGAERADTSVTAMAAALSLALVDARVMRGSAGEATARVPGPALESVALFAVMLWMQSDRSETDDEAAMDAATELAIALAEEADRAFRARDATRLAALYAEFVHHV